MMCLADRKPGGDGKGGRQRDGPCCGCKAAHFSRRQCQTEPSSLNPIFRVYGVLRERCCAAMPIVPMISSRILWSAHCPVGKPDARLTIYVAGFIRSCSTASAATEIGCGDAAPIMTCP